VALVYDDSMDHVGGIPQYLSVLGRALSRTGHHVSLLVGDTRRTEVGGCRVESLARNVTVRFNGNVLRMPVVPDVRRIRIAAGQFDVVHVQVPYSPVMAGRLIRELPETTALIGTFHVAAEHVIPRVGARLLAAATPATRHRFDEMICVSRHAAAFARATFGIRDPHIVPNMVELTSFAAAPLRPLSVPTVVSLGALVPRKGPLELIRAFALVRAVLPDARLVMGGNGPLRDRAQRLIRRLGLAGAVELIGSIPEAQKAALLRDAHVACFPSRYGESFGIVLLEAMAVNGPAVLAGSNGGYSEVLASIPEALCTPEPAPLAASLVRLLRDAPARRDIAQRQHCLVRRYDANVVTQQVTAVYHAALVKREGARSAHACAT
jgi:phosphatidylinositol alpha-mannosyltransferase